MGVKCGLWNLECNMHCSLFKQSAQDGSVFGPSADELPVNFSCLAERGLGSSDAQLARGWHEPQWDTQGRENYSEEIIRKTITCMTYKDMKEPKD